MIITDSQIHISNSNPGATNSGAHGPLEASEIVAEMDRAGVARAVLVPHGAKDGQNDLGLNDRALATAADYPGRFGVMGLAPLRDPNAVDISKWLNQPGMLGVRIPFQQFSLGVLTDGTADWFFGAAEESDIPVMVFAPGQAPAIGEIARRYPNLRLIVDHLNVEIHSRRRDFDLSPEIDELLPLSQAPHIAVKVSGLPSLVTEAFPFPTLHPHIQRVVKAFGADRCMWGSDLPRLTCPYGDWVRAVTDGMEFLSSTEKELLLSGSISAWLNWPDSDVVFSDRSPTT